MYSTLHSAITLPPPTSESNTPNQPLLASPPTDEYPPLRQLWQATHHYYYALPRALVQLTLLPFCYHHMRAAFNSFLTRFPSLFTSPPHPIVISSSFSPCLLSLSLLAYFHHSLHTLLSPTSDSFSPSPISPPGETPLQKLIASNSELTPRLLANLTCGFLGDWIQLPHASNNRPTTHLLLSYLFASSFPAAASSAISILLLRLSLSANDFVIMVKCLNALSPTYFDANYKTVVQNVSKMLLEGVGLPIASTTRSTLFSRHVVIL